MANPVIRAKGVSKVFGKRTGFRAVDSVDLDVRDDEVVGIVGESGSGKSTLARMICGLLPYDEGSITVDDRELSGVKKSDLWRSVQLVPQDSYGSLNPALSILDIVAEPIRYQLGKSWKQARAEAAAGLDHVGLPAEVAARRPTEISGGQRQRVALARALAVEPRVLVCDESTSALDVSVQAQILVLIKRLREERPFGLVFVSHDISVVRYLSDRVLVMSAGKVVERTDAIDLTQDGVRDPYTKELLAAVPTFRRARADLSRAAS